MRKRTVVALLGVLLMSVAVIPAAALELLGEHRLLVIQAADGPELRVAEALILRSGDRWLELVITQRWSPLWPARLDAEVSLWRTWGEWDCGAGVLWRVGENRAEPWVMVGRPW